MSEENKTKVPKLVPGDKVRLIGTNRIYFVINVFENKAHGLDDETWAELKNTDISFSNAWWPDYLLEVVK